MENEARKHYINVKIYVVSALKSLTINLPLVVFEEVKAADIVQWGEEMD